MGCKNRKINQITDFALTYKENFKVLFLTDIQIIDPSQSRSIDRLSDEQKRIWDISKINELCFNVMDKMVNRVKPDLIALGGDNVYGEFDDNTSVLKTLVKHMNKYKIPFTFVYGNHDNECVKGRSAQNEIWQSSKRCMYKDMFNSIGLYDKKGNLKRIIYMYDSNGCSNASQKSFEDGVYSTSRVAPEQRTAIFAMKDKLNANNALNVPSTFVQHIMPYDVKRLLETNGILSDPFKSLTLTEDGSFGSAYEKPSAMAGEMIDYYELLNCDSAMYGHDHTNNFSVKVNDIRYTYMTKSSYYDYHRDDMIGGTVAEIKNDGKDFVIHHEYYSNK